MGWPRRGGLEDRGLGGAPQLADPRVPAPPPAGRASFPNMVCSPPDGAHSDSVRGGGTAPPPPPQRVTPEHGATRLGPLSPCPVTTGSASRVSHRKTPPAKGGGCRQGHALQTPPPQRRAAGGWRASRGALGSAGLSGGWRAPPRARASGKGGQGERNPPGPRRAPRELPGPLHPGRPSHRRCEPVEQSGPILR